MQIPRSSFRARSSSRSAAKASRSVRSSPPNSAFVTPASSTSRRTAIPLWTVASGRSSSTIRPRCGTRPSSSASTAISRARCAAAPAFGGAAPVDRLDRALVLETEAVGAESVPVETRDEPGRRRAAVAELRVEPGTRVARAEQLESVVAGIGERLDPDHPPRGARPAAADAGDEPVAAGELGAAPVGPPAGPPRPRGRRRSAPGCRRCRRGSPRRPDRPAAARGSGQRPFRRLVSRDTALSIATCPATGSSKSL